MAVPFEVCDGGNVRLGRVRQHLARGRNYCNPRANHFAKMSNSILEFVRTLVRPIFAQRFSQRRGLFRQPFVNLMLKERLVRVREYPAQEGDKSQRQQAC
jgi:hypothetical protein